MANSNRAELDQQIGELYQQYKGSQIKGSTSKVWSERFRFLPLVGRLLKSDTENKQRAIKDLYYQISHLVRHRPGRYPLEELIYGPAFHVGFQYGFKHLMDGDVFRAGYFSYNEWGIDVIKHHKGYSPRIQVFSTLSSGFHRLTCLHLPEGFTIPVGPLQFEEESLPADEDEIEKAKKQALSIAKQVGINISPGILEQTGRFMEGFGPRRTYPDRYFYWQPVFPNKRAKIAIDFDSIKPMNMGLRLEGAPVFNDTKIVEEDF